MIVLNPNNTIHRLKVIPRYYPEGGVVLTLKNEVTSESESFDVEPEILDGYMYINFEETFINNSNYQATITEGSECVFRGKIFITNQANDTQNYSISKDVFTYE